VLTRKFAFGVTVLSLSFATPALAQNQGTISGRVVLSGTTRGIVGAQVSIPGTGLGRVANAEGRYILTNVPVGSVRVRAELIGHATQDKTVTVMAGQTVTVDFELTQEALGLDAIVVTGTAGGSQRRAIGNVVTSVNAAAVMARAPIQNVDQLIGQRTTGVRLSTQTGQVGTGAAVRIRGIASLTQGNDPIVYIDGVRMYSNPRDGVSQRGGANQSRLNDVNPADIETIEIIKGPAAATLYGTEASNGVIQIITKRGRSGRPQFEVTSRLGLNWLQNPSGRASDGRCFVATAAQQAQLPPGIPLSTWPDDAHQAGTYCFNVYQNEIDNHNGPMYQDGLLQSHSLSVRGGTDLIRYFSSISTVNDVGIVDWNWDKRTTIRLNLESLLFEGLNVSVGGAYITGKTRLSESSLQTSTYHNIVRSNPVQLLDARRGWGQVPPEDMAAVEARNDVDRTTMSIQLSYKPLSWMTHRLIGGLDQNSYDQWILTPRFPNGQAHWYGILALGNKEFVKGTRRFYTLDYSGSANLDWREFTFQPSVGFQFYKTEHVNITASGNDFPALPITTVSGGAVRQGAEAFSENVTVGVYVQQQVGWKNRAFVTAAVRADDNSAFGVDFDAAIYPKLSATWVLSDEEFWPVPFIETFRARSAWGAAGKQPDAFAASRLYEPAIGFRDQPSLVTGAYGNAALKPERGEELELGFDASLFDDRLGIEYTHYRKALKDAILNRTLPPSSGFTGSQLVNVGRVNIWGHELSARLKVLDRSKFAWDTDLQFSTNHSKIINMGGVVSDFNREGYPIASYFTRVVLSATIDANRNVTSAMCDGGRGRDGIEPGGPPMPCDSAPLLFLRSTAPVWDIGLSNTFTLFNNLRLYMRVEGSGGHVQTQDISGGNHRDAFRTDNPMYWAIMRYGRTGNQGALNLYDAGFLRLREVSASYDLPARLAGAVSANNASISLAFRNLAMLWTEQMGWDTPRDGSFRVKNRDIVFWDPENRGAAQNQSLSFGQTVIPPTSSAIMTFRVSF
jgi:TonB-dependent starch-binding outer membrane protein SusC